MQQLKLLDTPEPYLYHADDSEKRHGFFSVLTGGETPSAKKRQKSFRLDKLAWVLDNLNPKYDQWICQGEFGKPNRRVVNLVRIGLLFVDLDTYTCSLGSKTPEQQAGYVRYYCGQQGIPQPTLIVYSGRGLQLKWILDRPLPAAALPRWNACQKVLVDSLLEIGADRVARDASRVLRVERTVNTKSGRLVRVLDFTGTRYDFDDLADELLPIAREALRQKRDQRNKQLKLLPGKDQEGLRRFAKSGRQLAWDRLQDLRKLAALRGGLVDQPLRTTMLHWQLNFLLLSGATNHTLMYYEAAELSKQLGTQGWSVDQSHLSTLYRKAVQYAQGDEIEHQGRKYPALYTPKNGRLIDIFGITEDEQRQLRTIISVEEAKRRRAKRERARRAASGAIPRGEYEAGSVSAKKPWEALGISRATWYRLGKPHA